MFPQVSHQIQIMNQMRTLAFLLVALMVVTPLSFFDHGRCSKELETTCGHVRYNWSRPVLRSTWGPTDAVRARRPRQPAQPLRHQQAAEPPLRTSPTSRSGNHQPPVGRLNIAVVLTSTLQLPDRSSVTPPLASTTSAGRTDTSTSGSNMQNATITRSPLLSQGSSNMDVITATYLGSGQTVYAYAA